MRQYFGLLVLFCVGCASAPIAPPIGPALNQRVPALLEQYHVASASIAVISGGHIAFTGAYGEQSSGVRATPDTLYNLASLAKPISAEVMLRLVSAGRLSLDAPLSAHWVDPDLASDPRRDVLTLRVNLSHRTGFANWRRDSGGVLAFVHEPATGFHYSGEGYQYAGRYTEAATSEGFEQLAQRLVFDPIGMRSTAYTQRSWFEGRVAIPHDGDGAAGTADSVTHWNAADDVYSTAQDYGRFVLAVMRNQGVSGEIARQRLQITDDLRAEGCGANGLPAADCPNGVGMGLGWMVVHYGDETVLMHNGADWGEKTIAFFVPSRQLGLVVLTNSANGDKIFPELASLIYPNPHFRALLVMQAR